MIQYSVIPAAPYVLRNAPLTLGEIEKATLRLVAIRASHNMSNAAARLGMAPVSLSRWIGRRKLPPWIARRGSSR
jgi:hypothetical protein